MSADPSMRPEYVTPTPMPTALIHLKTLVYVPIWRLGHVAKWGYARVVEIGQSDGAPFYLVDLTHPLPGTSATVLYFAHSVQCGMCVGRPTYTPCPQCRPGENPWWS